jgi:ketosteroid isomerase-like protein
MRLHFACLAMSACLLLGMAAGVPAQERAVTKSSAATESELRKTISENITTTQAEDLDAMMKTIHSSSPLYQQTRQQVSQIFGKGLGLKYELLSLKYLASDGDYAFARVRQRTTKTPPGGFRNNEIDMIVAFRKEEGTWRIWNQAILEINYLNQ